MTMTRRNLPHLYFEFGIYFVTFRLESTFQKYDSILDSGKYGADYLKNDNVCKIVKDCLHYPDTKEYTLICYTMMSNHVHVVFELLEGNKGLDKIMQSIKGISARRANLVLNRSGTFWQDESFDRLIRNENEFCKVIRYVMSNPVKAGLVNNWKDWKNSYCNSEFMEYVEEIFL